MNLVSNLVLKMETEIRNPGTISEVEPGTLEVEPKTRQLGFRSGTLIKGGTRDPEILSQSSQNNDFFINLLHVAFP